ncbi:hypothetical protein B0H14DRAFT_2618311 [Mycena olivaceomarginata]|nr:hypothetical protein B0H14DRAFT_2618311 [Mycena olivaceomarginata]
MPKVDLFELFNGKSTFKVPSQYEAGYRTTTPTRLFLQRLLGTHRLQYHRFSDYSEAREKQWYIPQFKAEVKVKSNEMRDLIFNEGLLAETLAIFKEVKNESDSKSGRE